MGGSSFGVVREFNRFQETAAHCPSPAKARHYALRCDQSGRVQPAIRGNALLHETQPSVQLLASSAPTCPSSPKKAGAHDTHTSPRARRVLLAARPASARQDRLAHTTPRHSARPRPQSASPPCGHVAAHGSPVDERLRRAWTFGVPRPCRGQAKAASTSNLEGGMPRTWRPSKLSRMLKVRVKGKPATRTSIRTRTRRPATAAPPHGPTAAGWPFASASPRMCPF